MIGRESSRRKRDLDKQEVLISKEVERITDNLSKDLHLRSLI